MVASARAVILLATPAFSPSSPSSMSTVASSSLVSLAILSFSSLMILRRACLFFLNAAAIKFWVFSWNLRISSFFWATSTLSVRTVSSVSVLSASTSCFWVWALASSSAVSLSALPSVVAWSAASSSSMELAKASVWVVEMAISVFCWSTSSLSALHWSLNLALSVAFLVV